MRRVGVIRLVLVLLSVMWGAPHAGTRVPLPAAVTGQVVDGQTVGSSPFDLPPAVDRLTGDLLFRGSLSRGSAPQALFRLPADGQTAVTIAAAGAAVAPELRIDSFLAPSGCGSRITFWAALKSIAPSSADGSGIFLQDDDGQALPVALSGGTAPGGGAYAALGSTPAVDVNGRLVFLASTSDSDDELILFNRTAGGTMSRALQPGDTTAAGVAVDQLLNMQMTCDGTLLVLAIFDDGVGWRHGLFAEESGSWRLLLAQSDALPDGSIVLNLRLPLAATDDGALHLVVDRAAAAGAALLRLGSAGDILIQAAAGDAIATGASLVELGAPTPWSSTDVAWRGTLSAAAGLPPGAAPHAIMATGPALPATLLMTPGTPSPGGGVLTQLGHPAGAGDGLLHLVATASGDEVDEGLLTAGSSLTWSMASGATLPGWGRLLGGGFRTARPDIDSGGQAVFAASLPDGTGGDAVFISSAGLAPSRILTLGDNVIDGGSLTAFGGPPVIGAGGIAWVTAMTRDTNGLMGYVRAAEGTTPARVLSENDPSPAGGTFRTLGRVPAADSAGNLVFTATLSDAGSASGVFVLRSDQQTLSLATAGGDAPGGGTFSSFGFAPAVGAGSAAFRAFTTGGRVGSGLFAANLSTVPATLSALALSGDPAPGGGSFASFSDPVGGEDGTIAFSATLNNGSTALFSGSEGSYSRLILEGDWLTGVGLITALGSFTIDDSGTAYAAIQVDDGAGPALILALDGTTTVVLMEGGAQVPLPAGGQAVLAKFPALAASGDGQVVATADLAGWSAGAAVIHATSDRDGDGWGDPLDCAADDATTWMQPGAVTDLSVWPGAGSAVELLWTAAATLAGDGTADEILTGSVSALATTGVAGATCAASAITGGFVSISDALPTAGTAVWYLARGRNPCGAGALGGSSQPRMASARICTTAQESEAAYVRMSAP